MAETIVYDIDADKLIKELAAKLKGMDEFKVPEWAYFVKTSMARQRPPVEREWWFTRAASILRQMYTHGVVGVSRLRVKYGGKQNRGMKPSRFKKGSGKNIRVILQQAELAGLIEKVKGKRTGRKLTAKGKEFLESIAKSLR